MDISLQRSPSFAGVNPGILDRWVRALDPFSNCVKVIVGFVYCKIHSAGVAENLISQM